jgi:hypothetical protein
MPDCVSRRTRSARSSLEWIHSEIVTGMYSMIPVGTKGVVDTVITVSNQPQMDVVFNITVTVFHFDVAVRRLVSFPALARERIVIEGPTQKSLRTHR